MDSAVDPGRIGRGWAVGHGQEFEPEREELWPANVRRMGKQTNVP